MKQYVYRVFVLFYVILNLKAVTFGSIFGKFQKIIFPISDLKSQQNDSIAKISLFTKQDEYFMDRAINLAITAIGHTSPNPCVGCVIVSADGKIVGEGYHEKAGLPHAEVGAIKKAGKLARNGTAYVSLEPCNHYGRTPPCTLALINCGIKRVIAGMVDPDPRVSGKGIKFLANHGIEVGIGLKEQECIEANLPFIFRTLNNRPYICCWSFHDSKVNDNNLILNSLDINITRKYDSIVIPLDIFNFHQFSSICQLLPKHSRIIIINSYQNVKSININEIIKNLRYLKRQLLYYNSVENSIEVLTLSTVLNVNKQNKFDINNFIDLCYKQLYSNSILLLGCNDMIIRHLFDRKLVQQLLLTISKSYDILTSKYINKILLIYNNTSNVLDSNSEFKTIDSRLWKYP